jgi:hypothetical protein
MYKKYAHRSSYRTKKCAMDRADLQKRAEAGKTVSGAFPAA